MNAKHAIRFGVVRGKILRRSNADCAGVRLLAGRIGEERLRLEFLERLSAGGASDSLGRVPVAVARRAYRWDDEQTALFKYAVNFALPAPVRDGILTDMFGEHVGDPGEWGDRFYASGEQLREMQDGGMHIGGHSHRHEALGMSDLEDMRDELSCCMEAVSANLEGDSFAFSYPFGKKEHFSAKVIEALASNGFRVAFTNIQGVNAIGSYPTVQDQYGLSRIDPKDLDSFLGRANRQED